MIQERRILTKTSLSNIKLIQRNCSATKVQFCCTLNILRKMFTWAHRIFFIFAKESIKVWLGNFSHYPWYFLVNKIQLRIRWLELEQDVERDDTKGNYYYLDLDQHIIARIRKRYGFYREQISSMIRIKIDRILKKFPELDDIRAIANSYKCFCKLWKLLPNTSIVL